MLAVAVTVISPPVPRNLTPDVAATSIDAPTDEVVAYSLWIVAPTSRVHESFPLAPEEILCQYPVSFTTSANFLAKLSSIVILSMLSFQNFKSLESKEI